MARRPTIPDLARAAGVSPSTVNRVIGGSASVRQPTRARVLHAAERIGFYGLGSIEHSYRKNMETHRIGVLLQQENRSFYRDLGDAFERAATCYTDGAINLTLEFLDDLSPENVAARLISLGEGCESVALVAAQHALVSDAIDSVQGAGVPVFGLIAPLSARGNVGFVGIDNWKVGRTAAWAFNKICRKPGKIGILVGNHRYRNQEMNESGFRSYFREHSAGFTLLEPQSTFESSAVARELTEQLFAAHPDMRGLYVSGGGITGALAALRDRELAEGFVSVGYELFSATRAGLIDGTLTLAISHPMEAFAKEAVSSMVKAKNAPPGAGTQSVSLRFEIHTSENV